MNAFLRAWCKNRIRLTILISQWTMNDVPEIFHWFFSRPPPSLTSRVSHSSSSLWFHSNFRFPLTECKICCDYDRGKNRNGNRRAMENQLFEEKKNFLRVEEKRNRPLCKHSRTFRVLRKRLCQSWAHFKWNPQRKEVLSQETKMNCGWNVYAAEMWQNCFSELQGPEEIYL